MSKRLPYIDVMESIAILFVVTYHADIASYDILNAASAETFFTYIIRAILSTCVPLFFFANGYLLFNRDFHLKKHIIKTVRTLIQTGVWGIISLLLLAVIEGISFSPFGFLQALWTWKQDYLNHLWFMGALVCIYVFFPLLKCAFDYNKEALAFFVAACAVFTFGNKFLNALAFIGLNSVSYMDELAGHSVLNIENYNLFNIFNPFRGIYGYSFVYFCAGGFAYALKGKLHKSARTQWTAILGLCVMTLGLGLWGIYKTYVSGKVWDVVWYGYDTAFTFFNVICIYILCVNYNWNKLESGGGRYYIQQYAWNIFYP